MLMKTKAKRAKKAKPNITFSETVSAIREAYRTRQDFLMAEGNLARQMKSIERRITAVKHPPKPTKGGHMKYQQCTCKNKACHSKTLAQIVAIYSARESIHAEKMAAERYLTQLSRSLPVYAKFVEPLNGFGAVGLGQIVGEAGDLNNYSNPGKLWKRMGLGLFDGVIQRKTKDKELAVAMGYSPRRRSVMHVIGDSLLKQQNAYRKLYMERKKIEKRKAKEEGLRVAPAANIPKSKADKYRSQGHIHKRALRYMEKKLLKHLWQVWRGEKPNDDYVPT